MIPMYTTLKDVDQKRGTSHDKDLMRLEIHKALQWGAFYKLSHIKRIVIYVLSCRSSCAIYIIVNYLIFLKNLSSCISEIFQNRHPGLFCQTFIAMSEFLDSRRSGLWTLKSGFWAMDTGLWTLTL